MDRHRYSSSRWSGFSTRYPAPAPQESPEAQAQKFGETIGVGLGLRVREIVQGELKVERSRILWRDSLKQTTGKS